VLGVLFIYFGWDVNNYLFFSFKSSDFNREHLCMTHLNQFFLICAMPSQSVLLSFTVVSTQ
jgi:hypothetical protein